MDRTYPELSRREGGSLAMDNFGIDYRNSAKFNLKTASSNQIDKRLKKLYRKLKRLNLDSIFISKPENISYLTEYTSRDSYLILSGKGNFYLTDSRYTEEAKANIVKSFVIKKINGSLFKAVSETANELGLKALGIEEKHLSVWQHQNLRQNLDKNITIIPAYGIVEALRIIKTAAEIVKIRRAAQIAQEAFRFIKKYIKAGSRELEIAGELERFIRFKGGFGSSFDIIVASGANSAYPHHFTSARKIETNDVVLIDMGVDYLGYKSDLTRVLFLGKISILAKKIHNIVINAQQRAIHSIKPGFFISRLDKISRGFISEMGYGANFTHNLGHGIGLEVHEAPNISSKEEGKLKEGMVFTIEPGIYLESKFGIRIEDMVLVTKEGVEVISGTLDK